MTMVRVPAFQVTFALRWVVEPVTVMNAFAFVTVSLRTASLVFALMLAMRLAALAPFFGVVVDTAGPMLSTITTTPGDAADVLPSESVAVALNVWLPLVAPLTEVAHWPSADDVVVALTVAPSSTLIVALAGPLPATPNTPSRSGLPDAGALMTGAAGASTVLICSAQPPEMAPALRLPSSTTY